MPPTKVMMPSRMDRPSGTTFIGIDPGKSGGLATISPLSSLRRCHVSSARMPDTERGVWEWFKNGRSAVEFAVIERVHAMPGQGVTSMFTFGQGYGGLRMALIAACIPFQEVRPEVWQKALGVTPRKKHTRKEKVIIKVGKNKGKYKERGVGGEDKPEFKKRLVAFARNLFPDPQIVIDEWTADAILIAEYARRIGGKS